MLSLGPQAAPSILCLLFNLLSLTLEPAPGWVLRRQRKPALVCDSSILKFWSPKPPGEPVFPASLSPASTRPAPHLFGRLCCWCWGSVEVDLFTCTPVCFLHPLIPLCPVLPSCPWELSQYRWGQRLGGDRWMDPVATLCVLNPKMSELK